MKKKTLEKICRWTDLAALFLSMAIVIMLSNGRDIWTEVMCYWMVITVRWWAVWGLDLIYNRSDDDEDAEDDETPEKEPGRGIKGPHWGVRKNKDESDEEDEDNE